MRPLRKIPAGILLPLAELILGIGDFAPLRWSDQGLMVPKGNHTVCLQTVPAQFSKGKLSGSLANRGPRKPLKRLDLNFHIIIAPLSAKRGHSLCARVNRWIVYAYNLPTSERDRSVGLPPFGAWYHCGIMAAEAFRRVRSGGLFYGRADCEAGATVANKGAQTLRRICFHRMVIEAFNC